LISEYSSFLFPLVITTFLVLVGSIFFDLLPDEVAALDFKRSTSLGLIAFLAQSLYSYSEIYRIHGLAQVYASLKHRLLIGGS